MTEEIIIDGVNVRNCNRCNPFHYDRGASEYPICLTSLEQWGGLEHYCNQRPNCYYKQLIRLEQENETLKNSLKDFQYSDEQHLLKVIELEKENKNLKEDRDFWCKKSGDFENFLDTITNNEDKYRSALEEIKEIAFNGADVNDCTFCNSIFEKIEEVLQ